MAAPPVVINPHLNKVNFDPLRDFAPVALLTAIPNVLVVHPSVKAKSMRELVQLARSAPGRLTYASGGVGSSNHLAGELLKSVTATDIVHVPYKSCTIALTGAMGGEVDIVTAADSRERLSAMGGDASLGTPEQGAQLLRREYEQWGRVIREAGIKAE